MDEFGIEMQVEVWLMLMQKKVNTGCKGKLSDREGEA